MKKMLMILALALPLAVQAEEVNDTTVQYNGKRIVIRDDSVETHVAVFAKDSSEYRKTRETSFTGEQEVERFYVTSPFFNLGGHQYAPTVPLASIGFLGTSGSALGFGSADGMPTRTFHGYELSNHFLSMGLWLNKKHTWNLSMSEELTVCIFNFDKNYEFLKDADGRVYASYVPNGVKGSRMFAIGYRAKIMAKWYKYFNDPENDRICVGLGLAFDSHSPIGNSSSYDIDGYTYSGGVGMKMKNRVSLCAQFSYDGIIFYFQKSLEPMFKSGMGPKCYPFSFGIGFAL